MQKGRTSGFGIIIALYNSPKHTVMKVIKLYTRNTNQAVVRELKAHKSGNSIFISEEELKNMDTNMMIA
jgi:hypothetical protein